MNYYKLTFSTGESFNVEDEKSQIALLRHIQRDVSACYFDNIYLIERPVRLEKLNEKPNGKIYERWSEKISN